MVSEIQRLMDGESEMNREKWGISMDTQNLVNLSEKPNHHITMMIFHCLEVLEPRGANFGSFQLCRVGTVECEHSKVSEPR